MKRTLVLSALALALVPAATFAQSTSTVTREQVRSELAALRQAGYTGDTEGSYPDRLLAAERRIAQQQTAAAAGTAVGGAAGGHSESGARTHANADETPGLRPIYSGN